MANQQTSRVLYVLLDDIQQMGTSEYRKMLNFFKMLDSEKHAVRILMTGTPRFVNEIADFKLLLGVIDLNEKAKSTGDISR